MKIVNVNKFLYLRGGAERAFFSLTKLLEHHGHEVIPFSMHHPLNLPSPYSKYFVSNVEFGGRKTSLQPSPARRGSSSKVIKESARPASTSIADASMEHAVSAGMGNRWAELECGRGNIRMGSHTEHTAVPRRGSEDGEAGEAGDHQHHLLPNAVRAVGRMFWSFEAARKFDQLLTDAKPDLIHIHNIYHHLSPSILPVAKRHNIPVVMTAHDYQLIWPDYLLCGYPLETSPTDLTPALSRPHPRPLLQGEGATATKKRHISPWRIIPRRCTHGSFVKSALTALEWSLHHWLGVYRNNIDRIIVPSVYVHDVFISAGIATDRMTVLPHFIETPLLTPGVNTTKPTILYFGRLSKEKGVDTLLRMMHNEKSSVSLRIAGEGPLENELRMMNAELGMNDRVTFLGRLGADELRREIQRAWCTVVPSVVPETFGYSVLESLAQGTPVIASDIGALPELIQTLGGGITVTPGSAQALGDAIATILKNPEHWRAEANRARTSIESDFSPDAYYNKLLSLYNELTAR